MFADIYWCNQSEWRPMGQCKQLYSQTLSLIVRLMEEKQRRKKNDEGRLLPGVSLVMTLIGWVVNNHGGKFLKKTVILKLTLSNLFTQKHTKSWERSKRLSKRRWSCSSIKSQRNFSYSQMILKWLNMKIHCFVYQAIHLNFNRLHVRTFPNNRWIITAFVRYN